MVMRDLPYALTHSTDEQSWLSDGSDVKTISERSAHTPCRDQRSIVNQDRRRFTGSMPENGRRRMMRGVAEMTNQVEELSVYGNPQRTVGIDVDVVRRAIDTEVLSE
jgi:hypothetical protein